MNEYRRLSYLEALGVSSYLPRRGLPQAPQPFLCDLPEQPVAEEPANAPDAVEVSGADTVSIQTAPQAIGRLLDQVGAKPARTASSDAPAIPSPATQPGIDPFTLSVWRTNELLVVDSRQADMPLPTERLLHNILLSLGGDWCGVRPAEEILSWPLVENDREFCTEAHARGQLEAWLDAELVRAPVARLLVMGETAARYLLPESLSHQKVRWQWQTLSAPKVEILVAPSLAELLRQPALKAHLWLALQPLRG